MLQFFSNTEEDLQRLLNAVVEASNRQGLTLNCKNIECTVVSKQIGIKCQLSIVNEQKKTGEKF